MSATLPPFRFDHLHVRHADPDAAGRFFVDMLGGEHRSRVEGDGRLRVTVAVAGVPLFIDRIAADGPAAPDAPYAGLEHIGFATDDVDETIAALEARGVEILVRPHDIGPTTRIAFIRGPGLMRIEFLQRR